jgi:hypothetical protein
MHFSSPHSYYIPCTSHPPWLYHSNQNLYTQNKRLSCIFVTK